MKRTIQKRKFVAGLIILGLFSLCVATAWATVSFVKPADSVIQSPDGSGFSSLGVTKARAPEPATMVLFGSGFLGMIISFVRRTYAITKRIFDVITSISGLIIL